VNYDLQAKFLRQFLPSLVEGSRAFWCVGASGDEGTPLGARAQSALQTAAVLYKPRLPTLNFFFCCFLQFRNYLRNIYKFLTSWSTIKAHWFLACKKLVVYLKVELYLAHFCSNYETSYCMNIAGCLWKPEHPTIRGANTLRSRSPWTSNFCGMELALSHHSEICKFEVAAVVMENICNSAISI
jgi:hypothetical protein